MPTLQTRRAPPAPLEELPRSTHNEYADEAARAAQRYHDQVRDIDRLTRERDTWERRALAAEEEIKRQQRAIEALEAQLGRVRDDLTTERDSYKHRLTTVVGHFHTAGAIILKCLDAADAEAPKKINMAALASAIDADTQTLRAAAEAGPEGPELPEFLKKGQDDGQT